MGDLARGQAPLDLLPEAAVASTGPTDGSGSTDGDSSTDGSTGRQKARAVAPRRVAMYVHLSEAALTGGDPIARLERGNALVTAEQVAAWCRRPDTAQVIVRPVLDLDQCTSSGGDRVTAAIAEKVAVRDRTCVFPWCTRPARRCRPDEHEHPCDNDHVHPRAQQGATCSCNIAPLCRRHHRLKTHSPWSYVVVDPGTYVWTSPHGYQFLRDRIGTQDISEDRPRLRADSTREPARPPDT
jgi:hypothetical protein